MSADLENIMFFNDGMCRIKASSGSNGREVVRLLASIEVSQRDGTTKVYTVKALTQELQGGGKKEEERVVLHSKSFLSAYHGHNVLGAAASVWSISSGQKGELMIIGPIVKLNFADTPFQTFDDSIYWREPRRNH